MSKCPSSAVSNSKPTRVPKCSQARMSERTKAGVQKCAKTRMPERTKARMPERTQAGVQKCSETGVQKCTKTRVPERTKARMPERAKARMPERAKARVPKRTQAGVPGTVPANTVVQSLLLMGLASLFCTFVNASERRKSSINYLTASCAVVDGQHYFRRLHPLPQDPYCLGRCSYYQLFPSLHHQKATIVIWTNVAITLISKQSEFNCLMKLFLLTVSVYLLLKSFASLLSSN